jgi:hypothetical protein
MAQQRPYPITLDERRLATQLGRRPRPPARSLKVKGFGCRPVVTYPAVLGAGVRKPPGRNPRGAGVRSAVYGDLTGRLVGWGMRWPV